MFTRKNEIWEVMQRNARSLVTNTRWLTRGDAVGVGIWFNQMVEKRKDAGVVWKEFIQIVDSLRGYAGHVALAVRPIRAQNEWLR